MENFDVTEKFNINMILAKDIEFDPYTKVMSNIMNITNILKLDSENKAIFQLALLMNGTLTKQYYVNLLIIKKLDDGKSTFLFLGSQPILKNETLEYLENNPGVNINTNQVVNLRIGFPEQGDFILRAIINDTNIHELEKSSRPSVIKESLNVKKHLAICDLNFKVIQ